MKELALILRKKRMDRGAIDFNFDEAKIVLDEKRFAMRRSQNTFSGQTHPMKIPIRIKLRPSVSLYTTWDIRSKV